MGLSIKSFIDIGLWLFYFSLLLLCVGIIMTVQSTDLSKGLKIILGIVLCLVAPIGWIIVLFFSMKQLTKKLVWFCCIIFGVGLVLFFSTGPKIIEIEEIESLRATHSLLIEMGGAINKRHNFSRSDFLSLTGLDLNAYTVASGTAQMRGQYSESLYLNDTKVSDSDLSKLKIFKALERLDLSNTQVIDAGVKRLKSVLPNCIIE